MIFAYFRQVPDQQKVTIFEIFSKQGVGVEKNLIIIGLLYLSVFTTFNGYKICILRKNVLRI